MKHTEFLKQVRQLASAMKKAQLVSFVVELSKSVHGELSDTFINEMYRAMEDSTAAQKEKSSIAIE